MALAHTRPVLLVDLDGVVANNDVNIQRRARAAGFDVGTPQTYSYQDYPEDARQFVYRQFEDSTLYAEATIMPDAIEGLWLLAHTHEIVGITARGHDYTTGKLNPEITAVTQEWLDRHSLPLSLLIFTPANNKLEVARKVPGAVGIVEDKPDTALAFALAGYRSYLIDWPYNRVWFGKENAGRVVRVPTLLEAARLEVERYI